MHKIITNLTNYTVHKTKIVDGDIHAEKQCPHCSLFTFYQRPISLITVRYIDDKSYDVNRYVSSTLQ